MSIAKVIEVIAEGKSVQEAMENAVTEASSSVSNIKNVYVESVQGIVKDGKIKKYRLNCKLTFVVDK